MARRGSARRNRVVRVYTNGKRADNAYGLSAHVGQIVKRADVAVKRAAASTARKMVPLVKQAITAVYNIAPGKLSDKFNVRVTPGTIRMTAHIRKFPLILFGGRWGGIQTAGATASIVRGESETYEHAFIATIQGNSSIRERRQVGGGRRVARGPVRLLRGPSPFEMAADTTHGAGVRPTVLRAATEFYIAELRRQYALEKKR